MLTHLDNKQFKAGEVINIPIESSSLSEVEGFQMEIDFNHNDLERSIESQSYSYLFIDF